MKRRNVGNTMLGRLFLAYILLFALSLITVSSISYVYKSSNSIRQVSKTYEKLLLQVDYNINNIYERALLNGEQLYDDPSIIAGLYAKELTEKEQTMVSTRMLVFVNSNNIYNSMYIYNAKQNYFFHTLSKNVEVPEIDRDIFKLLEERKKMTRIVLMPHIQSFVYNDIQYTDYLLSLVFK